MATSLFDPLRVGSVELPNRIVMAPLGRARADTATRAPTDRMVLYYRQRATAGLIVSEATHVSPDSVSRAGTSAIHNDQQVAGWRVVTDAVHDASGLIFQQLFHLGRKADPARLPRGGLPAAPSAVAAKGEFSTPTGPKPFPVPRRLDVEEIPGLVREFVGAAVNSRRAGFDGVEIHAANGFLIDQFLRDSANHRADPYGGSLVGRARFLLEVVDAVAGEIGVDRVGVRISPHATADGTDDSDPPGTFRYVAEQLSRRRIAYLHLIEPVETANDRRLALLLRQAFRGPLVLCGGFDGKTARAAVAENAADLVAFGVGFIANPDLVERIRLGAPWNVPDASTFYSGGDKGYVDYPFLRTQPELSAFSA